MDNLHLILLNIGRSVHHGDWNWKEISSPFARLYSVEKGSACLNLSSGKQELIPGNLYFIPPFTLHSYECRDYFAHSYIHIYEKSTSGVGILEEYNFPIELKASPLDISLIDRLLEINPGRELKQYDPDTYDNRPTLLRNIAEDAEQAECVALETKGILLQLLSRFLHSASPKSDVSDIRITKILNHIRRNINNPIRIKELSTLCHLSDDHFIRLFKKEMNCTPIQYINRKKIEKAQLMLLIENSPVKDIAYQLSFENLSYFNRLFKQITQYTPTQYYETLKGK